MGQRFVIADPHFGHKGMIMFSKTDGTPARPWGRVCDDMEPAEAAERVAAMDEAMVERWNAVVHPKDTVEVLGDVVINRRALPILARLNGDKRLYMGNHDVFTKKHSADYRPYFSTIAAYKVMPKDGIIMSHIPIHTCQLEGRWIGNIHGHMHHNRVMLNGSPDPRYLCVSVEQINYTPMAYEEALIFLK
jgi:calcineurin-like phosphoesterase family protein